MVIKLKKEGNHKRKYDFCRKKKIFLAKSLGKHARHVLGVGKGT